jgi:hypothetical protein
MEGQRARSSNLSAAMQAPLSATVKPSATTTSLPGKLNAAHASATAREHAAANSTVGKIADYERALTSETPNLDDAAKALASLTDKDLDARTIDALNSLLGIENVQADDVVAALGKARDSKDDPAATPADDATEVSSDEASPDTAVEDEANLSDAGKALANAAE